MKKYDETFKKMVIGFNESDQSRKQLSQEYAISPATISNWKRQYGTKPSKFEIKVGSNFAQLKNFQKETAKLSEKNEVLKKCISFFSVKKM